MQCAKFEQRVQQLLDDRNDVEQDEEIREHAEVCDTCGAYIHAQRRLFDGLRALPATGCSQDIGHRVLDELQLDQRRRARKRMRLIVLAVAAGIMIALLPFGGDRVRYLNDGEQSDGTLAMARPAPREEKMRALTEQESEEIRIIMRQFVGRISDHRLGMMEPVDQLASGIRPLAMTFNLAFDALRRTLPGYSAPPQPVEPQAFYHAFRRSIS